MAKPKITRIKAGETSVKMEEEQAPITRKKVVVKDKKLDAAKIKEARKAEKAAKKTEKAESGKGFFLFRYFREAWQEIRQVRWPNRKATFKMVLAVLAYTALFVLVISLLDLFFRWISGLILG